MNARCQKFISVLQDEVNVELHIIVENLTSFVRSPRENWSTATPRTMTPATRTVKNGSGKSPAWPTVFSTSSSEMLVSASCKVLMMRGRWVVTMSSKDICIPWEERNLTRADGRLVKESTPENVNINADSTKSPDRAEKNFMPLNQFCIGALRWVDVELLTFLCTLLFHDADLIINTELSWSLIMRNTKHSEDPLDPPKVTSVSTQRTRCVPPGDLDYLDDYMITESTVTTT